MIRLSRWRTTLSNWEERADEGPIFVKKKKKEMRLKPTYTVHDLNRLKTNFKCKQVKKNTTFRQLLDTLILSAVFGIYRQTCG